MESARATGGGAPGRLPAPGPLAGASRRTDVSAVPADVNLALLDHLTAEPELNLVRRFRCGRILPRISPSPLAWPAPGTTTSPVICVVGGHNSDDYGTSRILLHTIGFSEVTELVSDFKEQELDDDPHGDLVGLEAELARVRQSSASAAACRGFTPTFVIEHIPDFLAPK
ncbi:unnamed protein product [Musa textilis]